MFDQDTLNRICELNEILKMNKISIRGVDERSTNGVSYYEGTPLLAAHFELRIFALGFEHLVKIERESFYRLDISTLKREIIKSFNT